MVQIQGACGLDALLSRPGIVIVDFWAPWCPPCRMMGPVMEEVAEDYKGRATVAKCNSDDNRELMERYGIESIPCIIVFKNGLQALTLVGYRPKESLEEAIASVL